MNLALPVATEHGQSPSRIAMPSSGPGLGALLQLRGIGLRLGNKDVLSGLDRVVRPGETYVLLGANGSGKSSLAHLAMGCDGYAPTTGEIALEGRRIIPCPCSSAHASGSRWHGRSPPVSRRSR